MDVNSVMAANSTQRTAASGAKTASESQATVSYQTFLKLLLEQMRNQDPTAPMSSTDYMAQLSTFSQVEQSMVGNSKLDALLSAAALQQADGVIGRTITSADGQVTGEVASVRVTSEGAVAQLKGGEQLLLGPGIVIS